MSEGYANAKLTFQAVGPYTGICSEDNTLTEVNITRSSLLLFAPFTPFSLGPGAPSEQVFMSQKYTIPARVFTLLPNCTDPAQPLFPSAPHPDISERHRIAFICVAVVYGLFVVASTVLFYLRASHDTQLTQRSVRITCICGFHTVIGGVLLILGTAYHGAFPCFLILLALYLGVVPCVIAYEARAIRLLLLWRASQYKMAGTHKELDPHSRATTLRAHIKQKLLPTSQASIEKLINLGYFFLFAIDLLFIAIVLVSERYLGVGSSFGVTPQISFKCPLNISYMYAPAYVTVGVYILIFCPTMIYLLRDVRDGFGIKNDVLITFLTGTPCYFLFFVWYSILEPMYKDYWSSNLWPVVAVFFAHFSAVVLPLIVHYRRRHTKPKLGRSLGSRCGSAFTIEAPGFDADFERVLTHPVLFARFRTHCAQHFCSENIRMIENYQGLKFLTIQAFRGVAKGDGASVSQVTLGTDSGTEAITPAESPLGFPLIPPTLMLREETSTDYGYSYLNVPSTALRRRGSASGNLLDSPPSLLVASETPVSPPSNSVSHQTTLAEPDFMTSPTVFIAPTITTLLRQLQPNNPKCNLDPENEVGRTIPTYLRPAYLSFYSTFTVRDAPLEVNLNSDTRERVRMLVDQDRFEVGMFDDAMREVLSNLLMDAFRTFTVRRLELRHPATKETVVGVNDIIRGEQPLEHLEETAFSVTDGENPIALQVRSWVLD